MKLCIVVLSLVCLISCKGKDGKDGLLGRSFTSSIINLNGPIASDQFDVTVPGLSISRGDILQVFNCLNATCVQLSIYQPGTGINSFYSVQGNVVTIYNGLSAGNTLWYVTALLKV